MAEPGQRCERAQHEPAELRRGHNREKLCERRREARREGSGSASEEGREGRTEGRREGCTPPPRSGTRKLARDPLEIIVSQKTRRWREK
jgi:hypothetical protein